jgi:hypothetical protein
MLDNRNSSFSECIARTLWDFLISEQLYSLLTCHVSYFQNGASERRIEESQALFTENEIYKESVTKLSIK